jgi:hypothetical protein
MILVHASDQLVIGQVCKRFYNISCELESFHLTISDEWSERIWGPADDAVFESILCSGRKIDSIKIASSGDLHSDRLLKVLEVVGSNVKEAYIRASKASVEGFQLLNLMPNLERLELRIEDVSSEIPGELKLQLGRLKHLKLWYPSIKVLELFDRLPEDVLFVVSRFRWSIIMQVLRQSEETQEN